MTQPFTSKLWMDQIYQLADGHGFVMSALTALSTLHESFAQPVEVRNRLEIVAANHYQTAIHDICKADGSDLSVEAVLTASLIFYSLESLRGSFYRALQHAYSGVKIIGDKRLPASPRSPRTTQLAMELYRNFLSLQNQVKELSEWTSKRAFDTILGFDPPTVGHFNSVEDALHHLNIIHNEIYCISQYCQFLQMSNQSLVDVYAVDIGPRLLKAQNRFRQWSHGIKQLQARDRNALENPSQGYLLLLIYDLVFGASFRSIHTAECFNTYDPDLAKALDIAEKFLANENNPFSAQRPFSVYSGIIPVLFMMAWRSNNDIIRDKSLRLLGMGWRREGLWDSRLTLRLAEHVVALKRKLGANGSGNSESVQIGLRFASESACEMTCVYLGNNEAGGQTMMPLEGSGRERMITVSVQLDFL
jgi:hypothetical protein